MVAGLGLFSAWWRLDRSDWKLDEATYAQSGWILVHDGIDPNLGHPPLAKLVFGGAQVVLGQDLVAIRSVAALAFLASMAILFDLGRRIGGWWTGIAASALFAVLPRSMVVGGWSVADLRIERYGLLETVAAPLLLGSVLCGWRWISGDGRRWAVACGALVGLAGASKLNALVAVAAIAVVGAALRWGRRGLGVDLAALGGAALAGFVLPFAVFGRRAFEQIGDVLRFPGERAEAGHLLVLGGDVYDRSPWWAQLRYAWDADGVVLVLAVVAGLLLALRAKERPAVAYVLAVTASLVLSAMASPVALPHYRAMWVGLLVLLVAMGVVDALADPSWRLAGAAVLAVLAGWGLVATAQLATLGDGDHRQLAEAAAADGVDPERIVIYSDSMAPYFDGAVDALAPFDDGSTPAQLVVLDPSLTDAVSPETVETWRAWARSWGLAPHRVGRLEGWWAEP